MYYISILFILFNMSKDNFKKFVSNHPELVNYVKNNNVTWQSLYELYDLYGEDNKVWNKYFNSGISEINISGLLNTIKNINLDSLEENITSIQKAVNLVSELTKKKEKKKVKPKEESLDKLYGEDNET